MRQVVIGGLAVVTCGAVLAAQGAPSRTLPAPSATAQAQLQAPAAPRPVAAHAAAGTALSPAEQTALVGQYCATCHSARGKAGGLSLASFDAAKITGRAG